MQRQSITIYVDERDDFDLGDKLKYSFTVELGKEKVEIDELGIYNLGFVNCNNLLIWVVNKNGKRDINIDDLCQ